MGCIDFLLSSVSRLGSISLVLTLRMFRGVGGGGVKIGWLFKRYTSMVPSFNYH